jgi:phosphatidate cytidylyltransferase
MLKSRVLTSLILAPLALWAIWASSSNIFALGVALIITMGAWEWARLCDLHSFLARLSYVALIVVSIVAVHHFAASSESQMFVLFAAVVWWAVALLSVLGYPRSAALWRLAPVRGVAGILVMVPAWAALLLLHQRFGPGFVILLVMLIWAADTGAYFAGRAFGKRKLAPKVSPGKTWEGVAGGMLLALLIALVSTYWLSPVDGMIAFLALVVLTVGLSILGDLLESLFKRIAAVKDSGGLLPGHGGVLDRIDSMTAAAPMFTLGLLWLSR